MTLTRTKADKPYTADKNGHGKHAGHTTQMFLRKFWVNLGLTIPIIISYFSPDTIPYSNFVSLILGTVVFVYGGWIFIIGAWRELRGKSPGMMTLIALAVLTAFIYSIYGTITGGETLFWELSSLITVMLLGHYLEMRAVSGAQSALKELSKLLPDEAELIINPSLYPSPHEGRGWRGVPPSKGEAVRTEKIPIAKLKKGDLILARPGGRIPADGVIVEGESDVDEAIVTGESKPVSKKPGLEVIAGTTNGDGSLQVKVTKIGKQTFLAGVMRLVAEAQSSKSKIQILADKSAYYLTLIAVAAGVITFASWMFIEGNPSFAIERLVAVLVIACPHALGLAIPLVASISTTLAARKGFLVKQRLALESARNIDIVLFDKTGTLTKGEFGVERISVHSKQYTENEVLKLAASVDAHSEHFIAKALVKEAQKREINLLNVKNFQRIPGKGVKGIAQGKEVLVGGEALLNDLSSVSFATSSDTSYPSPGEEGFAINFPPQETRQPVGQVGRDQGRGRTLIYVISNNELLGSIALSDQIREESREAIAKLKTTGIKTAMITGDSEEVAKWVADALQIDEYFARVLPEEKSQKVKMLQERGLKVAMVGDGVNDAPALTQADVGIAIGAGTNVAIESAGIILIQNDPRAIAKIIHLSKLTYRKMIQNLFWAAGYNVIALPLAAGVLASKGIILQPALAALFMSLSTVIVAINAVLLRNQKI